MKVLRLMKHHVIAVSLIGLLAPLVITSVEPSPASAIAATGDYIVIFKDGVNLDRKVAKEAGLGMRSAMCIRRLSRALLPNSTTLT